MKKITAVLLILVMIFSFAACGDESSSPTISQSGTTSTHLLTKYININKTGKYILKSSYTMSDGTTVPMSITISGTDKKLITFTFPKEMLTNATSDYPMSFLINGSNKYMVFSSEKAYATLSDDDLNIGSLKTLITNPYLALSSLSYKSNGTTTVNNVEYKYEDYLNPTSNVTLRFLFNSDKDLVMKGTVENGAVTSYEELEILGDVTDDMFLLSSDYQTSTEIQSSADSLIATLKEKTAQ